MFRAACIVVSVIATLHTARADGIELGVRVGAFGTRALGELPPETEHDVGTGLQAELTTRIASRVSVGGIVGFEGPARTYVFDGRSMFDQTFEYRYHPLTAGAIASYLPSDRVWVSGWLGLAKPLTTNLCTTYYDHVDPSRNSHSCEMEVQLSELEATYAVGLGAGVDLWTAGMHNLGVAATLTHTGGDYTSVGLSLAYRYR